jgi:glutamate dehydrogenase
MQQHRLKREIIATVVDNQMVNMCGPTFPSRLKAAAGCDTGALVIGFAAAREILGVDALWDQVSPWTARPRPRPDWRCTRPWPTPCAA